MARKFLHSDGKAWEQDPNYDYKAFRKQYYFFYGTLMDPTTLSKVLNNVTRAQVHPTKVIGYSCMLWSSYPALLPGFPGKTVYGMAYEIQSREEAEKLQAYETDNYRAESCLIDLNDGRQVRGKTFVWGADTALLKEGVFDLKDWQMKNLEDSCLRDRLLY